MRDWRRRETTPAVSRAVVALRPVETPPPGRSPMHTALDEIEQAAVEAEVLYVDVLLQLALARHLVDVVAGVAIGTEPTIAQVHAIRELRLVATALRELVVGYSRRH